MSWLPVLGSVVRSSTAGPMTPTAKTSLPVFPTLPQALATLLDMTQTHIPVLAGELIDLLGPRPGETVVDCTFGGGGHARLVAGRIGPAGTLVGIDRDPLAEERFAELSAELPCQVRFIRADFVTG